MSQPLDSTPEILALALELVSSTLPHQDQYIQKLKHYQALIDQSTDLKHSLLLSIQSEEVKQRSFAVVNGLIQENNRLQKTVTLLQEQLVMKVSELGEVRRLRGKCVKLEDEVRKYREENEGIGELEETIRTIRTQIDEMVEGGEKKKVRRESEVDPCVVLNRERQHILTLKRITESRRDEFELGWRVTKEMNDSLNRREEIQSETVGMMQRILEKERVESVVYQNGVVMENREEQELLGNYEREIVSLKEKIESQREGIEELERKLEDERVRHLRMVEDIGVGKLELEESRVKSDMLQFQLKELVKKIEFLDREKSMTQPSKEQSGSQLIQLREQNKQLTSELKASQKDKLHLQRQVQQMRNTNSTLTSEISELQHRILQTQTERRESMNNIKSISQQVERGATTSSNLQKQLRLLDQSNRGLVRKVDELEREKKRLGEEIGAGKRREEELRTSNQDTLRMETGRSTRVQSDESIEHNLNQLNEIIYLLTFQS